MSEATNQVTNPADLLDLYDVFILDLWGVVHNGIQPYPDSVDFMELAQKRGKTISLLSNAPRRVEQVKTSLVRNIGVPESGFNTLMTSGEDAFQAMKHRDEPFFANLSGKAWFLGEPNNDQSMLDGHGFEFTDDPSKAGFILNTGPSKPDAKVEDWDDKLDIWLENKTPMICANPDRVVHKGDVLQICGGSIAERFEDMGGTVSWHGKPFAGVYETVFKQVGLTDKTKALMVGDSFITDIAGGQAAGIDTCLVTGGIYRDRIKNEGLEPLIAETGFRPTHAILGLKA